MLCFYSSNFILSSFFLFYFITVLKGARVFLFCIHHTLGSCSTNIYIYIYIVYLFSRCGYIFCTYIYLYVQQWQKCRVIILHVSIKAQGEQRKTKELKPSKLPIQTKPKPANPVYVRARAIVTPRSNERNETLQQRQTTTTRRNEMCLTVWLGQEIKWLRNKERRFKRPTHQGLETRAGKRSS